IPAAGEVEQHQRDRQERQPDEQVRPDVQPDQFGGPRGPDVLAWYESLGVEQTAPELAHVHTLASRLAATRTAPTRETARRPSAGGAGDERACLRLAAKRSPSAPPPC